MSTKNDIPNDVLAVIAMALYDIQDEVHDPESNVLTIKRPAQAYLPWNDKALGMLQIPTKK
ncbi:MAG: hypothetical protein LBR34_09110 [Prevotella sp.]|jgi:hypothetical protein|nr:hypothetical protein [Prevotella sp.]